MKTGKLFAGVALATLSAACTNEVMQLEPQAPEAGNRPMVNVQLSFDEDAVQMGNGETRLEFDKVPGQGYQWLFAEGDRIGGLLMDTWNGQGCGIEHFNLVDYVHTNYAFIRQTGEDGKVQWVTPENAPVCEGNYFFYFPYNDKFAHRGYVGWDVNPEQKQYNEAGELFQMQAIKDNQKWIGYKFVKDELEGKVNKINFDFVPVFAMPTFDFTNMTGMELTVNKLVVRCTSNRRPEINPSAEHDLMATTMALTPATRGFRGVNEGWEDLTFGQKTAEMWKKAQSYTYNSEEEEQYVWPVLGKSDTQDGLDALRWNINGKELFPLNENHTPESIRQAPAYEYVADFTGVKGGYKVEAGYHVQAILTMPGGLYAYGNKQTFEAYLYVTTKAGDDYVVRIDLGKAQTQGATNTSGYDDIVSGAANKFLKPGMYTKFKASFDATAMQSYAITDFKVTSTKDLLWVLNEAEGDGIYDLDVTTSGSRVVLTKEVEDLLNEKPYIRLRVNGEITIGEDASENAINLLYFTNRHMKTKLNIINKQVRKPQDIVDPTTADSYLNTQLGTCGSIINVAKGAELQASEITVVASEFNNNGTAVTGEIRACEINNSGDLNSGDVYGAVENSGSMKSGDINGDVTNSGKLEAKKIYGNVENNGGELTAGDVTENVIINGGKLTVNKVTGYVENNGGEASVASVDGTVTNNKGTITLRGSEYKGKVTNEKEATMNITGASTLKAELVNAGTLNANCDVTGESAATNAGTINISKGQTFKFETIKNNISSTINVAEDAKLITLTNEENMIHNVGTINNDGKAHNIKNDGTIVAGAKSYTAITSGAGTVDNSKLGDVSYEKAPAQTVILKIADITGTTLKKLDDMILKADANKLIIEKGTIKVDEGQWFVKGHEVDNNQSYFAKGIELGDVTIDGQEKSKVVFYASDVLVKGRLFADTYTDAVFVKENTSAPTIMNVKGLLETADHATVRGTEDAILSIEGEGEVHNSGLIKNAKKENFKGIWTDNTIK